MFAAAAALTACNPEFEPVQLAPAPGAPRFSVSPRIPERLLGVPAPVPSVKGAGVEDRLVDCATCHSRRAGAALPTSTDALDLFHKGFKVEHGALTCDACHVAAQGDRLHLATGEQLVPADALRLCGQCHGPQLRDYQHGAHGGAVGFWDLSRGPREKNHCVDCHDPHVPKFLGGQPAPGPRARHEGGARHD